MSSLQPQYVRNTNHLSLHSALNMCWVSGWSVPLWNLLLFILKSNKSCAWNWRFQSKMFQSNPVMMTLNLKNASQIDLNLFQTLKNIAMLITVFPAATSWGLWTTHISKAAQRSFLQCYSSSNRLNYFKENTVLFLAVQLQLYSSSDLVGFKKGFNQARNFTSSFTICLSNMSVLNKLQSEEWILL